MLMTFNQIARFKPTTTAKRLKAYYHSDNCRPAVFLSYLRLINIVALLCPTVGRLEVDLYREEVRELFFSNRDVPGVINYLWRFRRFFTPRECCELLRGAVTETERRAQKRDFGNEVVAFGQTLLPVIGFFQSIPHFSKSITKDFRYFSIEYSENLEKSVDSPPQFEVFCY